MKNQINAFLSKKESLPIQWVVYLGILVTLTGLVLMAYLGLYNRYWSDDWCYNADFKELGVGGTVGTYFFTGEDAHRGYSTNRYSLTLLSGILYVAGISGAKMTAALVIVCWFASLFWLFSTLSKLPGFPPLSIIVLGSALLIYYTLYISPQRFQVLYWISGIHYSFSIIAGICIAGLIAYQITHANRNKALNYFAALLAFAGGGLSETGCAYLLSGTVLFLLITTFFKSKQTPWATKAFPVAMMTFLGLLASLVTLALSPSNDRTAALAAEPTGWLTTILLSFRYALDFIVDSFRSLPTPHLVFITTFMALAILSGKLATEEKPLDIWKTALVILLIGVVVWLLVAAVQAPSVRFYSAPPDPRGKSLARFTMLAGLAVIAWLSGQAINFRRQNKLFIALALLGITLNAVYTARSLTIIHAELPGFIYRANLWDQRDTAIRYAKEQGATKMEVIVIDTKDIGVRDIMRSSSMNNEWVTSCASRYYGLEAIKAVSP
jgi:hypothetical protein